MEGQQSENLGAVLGRTPSGIFILIAGDGEGKTTGMLASWVQQASFEPPQVTVAVNKKRYINEWLAKSPQLTLNLVGESQGHFLKQFGRGFEPDEPAFEGVETSTGENGIPVLSDCLGCLEGNVINSMEAGDHVIYLVELTAGQPSEELANSGPMVHIRKNGFNY